MAAALAAKKHILPLILNSKALVLRKYPLLAARTYTLYRDPPELVADDVAKVVRPQRQAKDELHIVVESVHTEKLGNLHISPRVSIKWLSDRAQEALGVTTQAKAGAYQPFMLKWVLVDVKAEEAWKNLPRSRQRRMSAVLHTSRGTKYCEDGRARLEDLSVADGTVSTCTPSKMKITSQLWRSHRYPDNTSDAIWYKEHPEELSHHETFHPAQQRLWHLYVQIYAAVAVFACIDLCLGVERSQRFTFRLRHPQMHPS